MRGFSALIFLFFAARSDRAMRVATMDNASDGDRIADEVIAGRTCRRSRRSSVMAGSIIAFHGTLTSY